MRSLDKRKKNAKTRFDSQHADLHKILDAKWKPILDKVAYDIWAVYQYGALLRMWFTDKHYIETRGQLPPSYRKNRRVRNSILTNPNHAPNISA